MLDAENLQEKCLQCKKLHTSRCDMSNLNQGMYNEEPLVLGPMEHKIELTNVEVVDSDDECVVVKKEPGTSTGK